MGWHVKILYAEGKFLVAETHCEERPTIHPLESHPSFSQILDCERPIFEFNTSLVHAVEMVYILPRIHKQ